MNNYDLIKQIQMRRPLWDKCGAKTDIRKREELWEEVADFMGCSKDVLKSRWRNLRDSYRKIIRKSEDVDTNKWPYYGAMEFMRDITMNVRPKIKRVGSPDEPHTLHSEDSIDPLVDEGVKREPADDLVTQFLQIGSEKQRTDDGKRDDEDYQFLLSLHSHFNLVPQNRKLPLRMKIEKLIYDEVYSNNSTTYN